MVVLRRELGTTEPFVSALSLGLVLSALGACSDDRAGRGDGDVSLDEGLPGDAGGADQGETAAGAEGEGGDAEGAESGDGSARLDVADDGADNGGDEGADVECNVDGEGNPTDIDFSYIWVANSPEGTVSKINTVTMVEEGRYLTRENGSGNPSRTSVALSGDVAVANRDGVPTLARDRLRGGPVKIAAVPERCKDKNGDGVIQTSTGKDNVLPWGEDECVVWVADVDISQRPIAWTGGEFDPATCTYENEKLWVVGSAFKEGVRFKSSTVVRLDGATGEPDATIELDGTEEAGAVAGYGGAADGDGNLWFIEAGPTMWFVDAETLTWGEIPIPDGIMGYGITVDGQGRPWVSDYYGSGMVGRYDPDTQTWATAHTGGAFGIMADATRLWMAPSAWGTIGLRAVDLETLAIVEEISLGGIRSKGVSIDFQGNVWVVEHGNTAHRYNPDTGDTESYSGLTSAYTYSDMTGWALRGAVGVPPPSVK